MDIITKENPYFTQSFMIHLPVINQCKFPLIKMNNFCNLHTVYFTEGVLYSSVILYHLFTYIAFHTFLLNLITSKKYECLCTSYIFGYINALEQMMF